MCYSINCCRSTTASVWNLGCLSFCGVHKRSSELLLIISSNLKIYAVWSSVWMYVPDTCRPQTVAWDARRTATVAMAFLCFQSFAIHLLYARPSVAPGERAPFVARKTIPTSTAASKQLIGSASLSHRFFMHHLHNKLWNVWVWWCSILEQLCRARRASVVRSAIKQLDIPLWSKSRRVDVCKSQNSSCSTQ